MVVERRELRIGGVSRKGRLQGGIMGVVVVVVGMGMLKGYRKRKTAGTKSIGEYQKETLDEAIYHQMV
ncbi:hypothetical protein IMZ48_38770 [Candidatus Bathyarchaeota archaeon]|nr:hypothetical protein [Candidatus Bathyarchaeota archaeon]